MAWKQWRAMAAEAGVGAGTGGGEAKPKITAFGPAGGAPHHDATWKRAPNKTGGGATHVRTFTSKLTPVGLEHMDKHINEWLDAHPDAEVKFAIMQVGEMGTSIGKEPALLVQVWI